MIAIFAFWQPISGIVWDVSHPLLGAVLQAISAAGSLLLFIAAFLLNPFDLVGLRQVFLYWRNMPNEPLPFSEPILYRYVRHPIYVGTLMALWFSPTMTVSRLLFNSLITIYILVGVRLEERDLEDSLPEYREYKKRVPMLIPRWSRKE